MKKTLALVLALMMCIGVLAACSNGGGAASTPAASAPAGGEPASVPDSLPEASGPVELRVVTSFGGSDGTRASFESLVAAWEVASGNTVLNESATSDEAWKSKVIADFETGSEPDVLFFFNGRDSNPFVEAGKVVSIDEIREVYPDYASNMKDDALGASPFDGKNYSIPLRGYWEGLFYNKNVLEAAGVDAPGADTTWDEFMTICQAIKDAGYTPIAVSLAEVPHYWFEFCVLNNGGYANHEIVPAGASDAQFANWAAGLNDIKDMYERGFFPANTNTMSNTEACDMIYNDEAAFLADGSWQINGFVENVGDRLEDFGVTFVPGKGDRQATDMIGGLSMGYYITRKAWDDPDKRAAAVSFVKTMTTDANVNFLADGIAATALKTGTAPAAEPNALQLSALDMLALSTGTVPAVQDSLSSDAKMVLFNDNMKLVATGDKTAEESIEEALARN